MVKAWARRAGEHLGGVILAVAVVIAALVSMSGIASAQEEPTTTAAAGAEEGTGASDEQLAMGAEVFSAVCASCHQAGGVGVPGQFPPLVDNPNTADAEYVATVIREGRTGTITVNGDTYNGVMPAQTALSDEEVDAVVAYIQSGFETPAGVVSTDPADAFTDSPLPGGAVMAWLVGVLIAVGIAGLVLWPRLVVPIDRLTVGWPTAWLKGGAIVIGIVIATVIIPERVIGIQAVADLSEPWPDLIVAGIWGVGFVATLAVLWHADRKNRI